MWWGDWFFHLQTLTNCFSNLSHISRLIGFVKIISKNILRLVFLWFSNSLCYNTRNKSLPQVTTVTHSPEEGLCSGMALATDWHSMAWASTLPGVWWPVLSTSPPHSSTRDRWGTEWVEKSRVEYLLVQVDQRAACLASLSLLVIIHVTWFIIENFVVDFYAR